MYAHLAEVRVEDGGVVETASKTIPILLQTVENHRNGDFIRHQVAFVDISFRLGAQFGALADVFTKDRAGLDVGGAVLVFQNCTLCAFAAAVWADQTEADTGLQAEAQVAEERSASSRLPCSPVG